MGKVITLKRDVMKYMSTGRFRTSCDDQNKLVKEEWRELFRVLISKGVESIDIDLEYISETYSKIYEYFKEGRFNDSDDILSYFESLADVDEDELSKAMSHNAILYRGCIESEDIEFIHQREVCVLKVTDVKEGKTWSFGGIYSNMKLNKDHFETIIDGDYVLTHGNSLLGLIVVKVLSKKEFDEYRKWFEKIHEHPKNVFMKYSRELESLLKD